MREGDTGQTFPKILPYWYPDPSIIANCIVTRTNRSCKFEPPPFEEEEDLTLLVPPQPHLGEPRLDLGLPLALLLAVFPTSLHLVHPLLGLPLHQF